MNTGWKLDSSIALNGAVWLCGKLDLMWLKSASACANLWRGIYCLAPQIPRLAKTTQKNIGLVRSNNRKKTIRLPKVPPHTRPRLPPVPANLVAQVRPRSPTAVHA